MSVALDLEGPIALLHLDRPGALNAIDGAMTDALERALDAVEAATDARAVILACRGLSFCAGNDVKEMAALRADEAEALVLRQGRLLTRLSALRQVTVAALDGYALGVGLHLALAADLRVTTNRARLGFPEIGFGVAPPFGLARLVHLVGGGHARDLLLTGRLVDPAEGLRLGLVHRVVSPPGLEAAAAALATDVTRHPPGGVARVKASLARLAAGEPANGVTDFGDALRVDPEVAARLRGFTGRRGRR